MNRFLLVSFGMTTLLWAGCGHSSYNEGNVQTYMVPVMEAAWIREGQPIEYAGESWYPIKDIETLLDSEVYPVGEYKGVQFFVEKVDTKPFERLYTKFSVNKFRYYQKRDND